MNRRMSIASLLFAFLMATSCCHGQAIDSAQNPARAYGHITINALADSMVRILSQVSRVHSNAPLMSIQGAPEDHWMGPGQEDPIWTIFLPFSDSIALTVMDIKRDTIFKAPTTMLKRGGYKISVFPDLHLPKAATYFLQATFCDSTFELRKFIYLK